MDGPNSGTVHAIISHLCLLPAFLCVTQFLILNRWETEQGRHRALAPLGLNLNPFRNQTSHMRDVVCYTWSLLGSRVLRRCIRDSGRSCLHYSAGQWYYPLQKVESPPSAGVGIMKGRLVGNAAFHGRRAFSGFRGKRTL